MGETTKIEWTDHTFNPWIGCTAVSPACDHCYAETLVHRYGWAEWGPGKPRHRTAISNWAQPLKWNRAAIAAGVRRRVFCASQADVFDAEVPDQWRIDLMDLIMRTPMLDWLLLTKRPQVAKKFFTDRPVPDNVWLGTTVENQTMANLRIPILLSISAKVRFLSCEPLLGPIVLSQDWYCWNDRINWIIVGGESGTDARPMHPEWARALRYTCTLSGIGFFFKQWGEWTPGENVDRQSGTVSTATWFDGGWSYDRENLANTEGHIDDEPDLYRVGKKAAGALLDGREHHDFPSPR